MNSHFLETRFWFIRLPSFCKLYNIIHPSFLPSLLPLSDCTQVHRIGLIIILSLRKLSLLVCSWPVVIYFVMWFFIFNNVISIPFEQLWLDNFTCRENTTPARYDNKGKNPNFEIYIFNSSGLLRPRDSLSLKHKYERADNIYVYIFLICLKIFWLLCKSQAGFLVSSILLCCLETTG